MARGGSLAALRAGIRASVDEMSTAAGREAQRSEELERAQRSRWATLPHEQLVPDASQPRKHFDAERLNALAESIRAVGLREPLRVYPVAGGRYRILDGQRRWHALGLLLQEGLEQFREVLVLLDDAPQGDARLKVEQLVTSVHKEVFVPLETASALREIAAHAGEDGQPLAAARLAERFGFNAKFVERHLRVARGLSDAERDLLLAGYPRAPLDPLEKLVGWLQGPAGAGLDAAAREEAVRLFAERRPAARLVPQLLRPLAAKKTAGRPRAVRVRAGRTADGGFAVALTIPPNRTQDGAELDRAEHELERALAELRRLRAEWSAGAH